MVEGLREFLTQSSKSETAASIQIQKFIEALVRAGDSRVSFFSTLAMKAIFINACSTVLASRPSRSRYSLYTLMTRLHGVRVFFGLNVFYLLKFEKTIGKQF